MERIMELLPVIISLFAVVISFIAAIYSKKAATAAITTANRMEWIKTVREYCTNFLIEFNKDHPDPQKLKELYISVQLYGHGSTYSDLFQYMKQCVLYAEDPKTQKDLQAKAALSQDLLSESQRILSGVWWRLKREAGISAFTDKKIGREYNKRFGQKQ